LAAASGNESVIVTGISAICFILQSATERPDKNRKLKDASKGAFKYVQRWAEVCMEASGISHLHKSEASRAERRHDVSRQSFLVKEILAGAAEYD
jgi:hypothetical protein